MRIAVVGATSRTGAHLLAEAARRGHEITASTRRPGSLPAGVPVRRTVTGDGRDPRVAGRTVCTTDLLPRPRALTRADAAALLLDLAESRERSRAAVNCCGV